MLKIPVLTFHGCSLRLAGHVSDLHCTSRALHNGSRALGRQLLSKQTAIGAVEKGFARSGDLSANVWCLDEAHDWILQASRSHPDPCVMIITSW